MTADIPRALWKKWGERIEEYKAERDGESGKKRLPKWNDEELAEMLAMRKAGKSCREIGEHYGFSSARAHQLVMKAISRGLLKDDRAKRGAA